jgi:two-component system, NtrC family, response regulator AtoC
MKAQGKDCPHIVVLDADPGILEYIQRILADRFKVTTFTRAGELNRSLTDSPTPDLLLMDWHVAEDEAEENALGLLARLRALKPSLPIIMLACSAELKEVVTATRMGAADVVLKPFNKADIDLAVEQCLKTSAKPKADNEVAEIPLDENTFFVRSSKRMK